MANGSTPQGAPESIPGLLKRNVQRFANAPAYREKEYGIWQTWTWAQAHAETRALALGLLALGLERGDHVAIIGRNRPAHYMSMVAVQMCGAIPVPLYQDAVAEEMAYVLEHSGARFVICGDQEQVDKVVEVQDRIHHIDQVIYTDKRGLRKYDHSAMNWMEDVRAEGKAGHTRFDAELDSRIAALGYDDTCVMLYTSGTTGRPKGVVVPDRGILRLVLQTHYVELSPDDVVLQMAPASFDASTFEIWGALLCGATLAIAPPGRPSLEGIADTLASQRVTVAWLTAPLFHLMVDQGRDDLKSVTWMPCGSSSSSSG